MYPLLIYFIKSFLSLGIFYFTWFFFFRKQTDFRFNRYYLIITTLLAVFVPLVHLPELFPVGFQNPMGHLSAIQISEILIENTGNHASAGIGLSLATVLWEIYLFGIIVMAVRFLVSLFQLFRLIGKSETKTEAGIKYVFTSGNLPVFSFFHLIFIRKEMFEKPHAAAIVIHEKIHVSQKHSLDLLTIEILCIFQWFNPFIYLVKKAVKENHEFIADSDITVSESSKTGYLNLLFREASGVEFSKITHNFSYSLLKKRMIMMKNQKSQKRMSVKLLLSVLALILTLFACDNTKQPNPKNPKKVFEVTKDKKIIIRGQTPAEQKAIATQVDTGQIFNMAEKMPEFPGGITKLMNYIATTIKYPTEARKAKIQGKVFVNFIIEKDGSVSHVKVLRGIGHGCDEESMRVVENMPRWIPGEQKGKPVRVSFNIPIKFSLE